MTKSNRSGGSKHVNRRDLLDLVQSHKLTKGFDPLLSLAIFANGQVPITFECFRQIVDLLSSKKPTPKNIRKALSIAESMTDYPVMSKDNMVTAAKEVAQYIYPKQRSIEIKDPNGNNPFSDLANAIMKSTKKNKIK